MSQHEPTTPDTCHICTTARAIGVGLGLTRDSKHDPKWICAECALIIEDIKRIKRMDAYEIKALDKVDELAGDYAADHGTDMAAMDDLTRRMLWKAVVQGYGAALREGIREGVPF